MYLANVYSLNFNENVIYIYIQGLINVRYLISDTHDKLR